MDCVIGGGLGAGEQAFDVKFAGISILFSASASGCCCLSIMLPISCSLFICTNSSTLPMWVVKAFCLQKDMSSDRVQMFRRYIPCEE